ncbi:MAG: DUF445 family protein, partial [Cyanobacteria bacterium P01_D01_bin.2]
AIRWLLDLALTQTQTTNQAKTARILGNILQDMLGQALPKMLQVWAQDDDFLADQIDHIFDRVLLEFRLTDAQAKQIAVWIRQGVLPPDRLRRLIIDFLTDRNIKVIDETLREKTSGTYWVVANIFGVRNALTRMRTYCLDEPTKCNNRITELITALRIENRFQEWLQNFSLQDLPISTAQQLRLTLRQTIRSYLQTDGASLLKGLSDSINWEDLAQRLLKRLRKSPVVVDSLDTVSQELALTLERYLEQDLENIVAQAIPILDIDQVIMERVNATSPQNLEMAIQGIVRNELQAIVNLGGILGFTIGLVQVGILLLQ